MIFDSIGILEDATLPPSSVYLVNTRTGQVLGIFNLGVTPEPEPTVTFVPFKPAPGRILVERAAPETSTPGGLILPDNAQKTLAHGRALAVGGPLDTFPTPCNVGDDIYFGKYAGDEITVGSTTYLILPFDAVYGCVVES